MSRRIVFAVAAILALTTATSGGTAASELRLGTRGDGAGDTYRFVRDSRTELEVGNEKGTLGSSRIVFELQVVAFEGDRRTLRYILREASYVGIEGFGDQAEERAWLGIPIEFESTFGYHPEKILRWGDVKAAYFAALDRTPEISSDRKAQIKASYGWLEAQGDGLVAGHVLHILLPLAQAQVSSLPYGSPTIPDEVWPVGGGVITPDRVTMSRTFSLDSVDEERCEVTFTNTSTDRRDRSGSGGYSRRRTTLSSYDGWVLSLTEQGVQRTEPATRQTTFLTITRQGETPGCGPR